MAMLGLLAFIGLTVDAGILYISVGHLRRAVDAAALAASAQFREGRTLDQQEASAREVVDLNGVEPTTLQLWICVPGQDKDDPLDDATHHDPSLCPAVDGAAQRKLIKVRATTMVHFAFLSIIGFHDTEIAAQAVSEAASVDIVLTIDTSDSMTFDAPTGDPLRDPDVCNNTDTAGTDDLPGECHPFEEVKQAAANFVERLNFPYDRVAVVTFALTPTVVIPLTNTLSPAEILDTIRNLQVSPKRYPEGDPKHTEGCSNIFGNYTVEDGNIVPTWPPVNDPSGCTNTSTGGGLKYAGNEFGRKPIRQESVWVVVLLTDGAANASEEDASISPPTLNKFCPESTWIINPYCRDSDVVSRHTVLTPTIWNNPPVSSGIPTPTSPHTEPYNPNSTWNAFVDPVTHLPTNDPYDDYDADDFARDMADFVACAPTYGEAAIWCRDSLNYIDDKGGQGAVIYAIGLGNLVINNPSGDRDAGDALLKYVANVGLDGNPDPNPPGGPVDPCYGITAPSGSAGNDSYNCGNYYYSEFGTGLSSVFESIASRIFTRLTQ
jgi:hypothetical protein